MALDLYELEQSESPQRLEQLLEPWPVPDGEPYIRRLDDDPWGRPYIYFLRGDGMPVLQCLGADGLPGGEGEATDITSVTLGLIEETAS